MKKGGLYNEKNIHSVKYFMGDDIMKKGITFFLVLFLFLFGFVNNGFATDARPINVNSDTFETTYNNEFDFENSTDINECQQVPEYIDKIINERLTSNNQTISTDQQNISKSAWNLTMGSDTTYLSSNDGDAYCTIWSGSENDGDYLYDWGTNSNSSYGGWADAKTYLISTLGSGDSFEGASVAWIGNEFTVTGTPSQQSCKVTFFGNYSGQVSVMSDASALSKIILRIIDKSNSNNVIMNGVINTSASGTINHYSTVTLIKNHTYEFQMLVWAEGHVDDPAPALNASTALSNYWNNGLGGYGINYSGIGFDWQ